MSAEAHLRHGHINERGLDIHVVQTGESSGSDFLLLHGWPEDWSIYEKVLTLLGAHTRAVAIDLPGIGGSRTPPPSGDKRWLAGQIINVIRVLGLRRVTLVGHDVGGQVVYACLRSFPAELAHAVMMDIVIPGVDPWAQVISNPHLWHFAFHAIPGLPETLVIGKTAEYFDYFFNILAGPRGVTQAERRHYVDAYSRPTALQTGFGWYRAFAQDEKDNQADHGKIVSIPVLYLRGDKEGSAMDDYVQGFRRVGIARLKSEIIPECGHFAPSEQPERVATALLKFGNRSGF